MKYRQERLSSLIQEELSKIILRNIDFSGCLVTLTNVEIDEKLSRAVVNFSVLSPCQGCPGRYFEQCAEGTPQDSQSVLKILEKNRKGFQYLLAKKIKIKSIPEIIFKIDKGPEKAAEVEKVLLNDKMNK